MNKLNTGMQISMPVLLLLFLMVLFIGCNNKISLPEAEKGVLDLSGWDLAKQGPVNLDGEWLFYWNTLLDPEDLVNPEYQGDPVYIQVPGSWNETEMSGEKLQSEGYATYCLTVQLGKNNSTISNLGIKIFDVNTAYKLWIDHELLLSIGTVEKSKDKMKPLYLPLVKGFVNEKEEFKLVIQVSNFFFPKSGIWKSIVLGKEEDVVKLRENAKSLDIFLTGVLLIVGIFNLCFFLMNKKHKETLYFGLLCLIVTTRILFSGERFFIELFPDFNWFLLQRIDLIFYYIGPSLIILFIHSLYPDDINKNIVVTYSILGLIFYSIILIIPVILFDYLYYTYQFIIYTGCIYGIYSLILAIIHKRNAARIILAGFIIFLLTALNDILYSMFIIRTSFMAPLGFLAFILAEIAIYIKYVRAEEELKIQQKKLIQAEKLVALGTIITGIAHEINNPNNSIMINSEIFRDTWDSIVHFLDKYAEEFGEFQVRGFHYSELKEELPLSINRIIDCSKKIQRIVSDLKNFAQNKQLELNEEVNVNNVIETAVRLLKSQINLSTNNFHLDYDSSVPRIKGNRQQIEQVMVNLIQNACQAIESKDKGLYINTKFMKEKKKINITIKDEGKGIDHTAISKLTDPFYTTKQTTGGTGLGLYISDKIIKEHNGKLEFKSVPGEGTEVTVIIPVADKGVTDNERENE